MGQYDPYGPRNDPYGQRYGQFLFFDRRRRHPGYLARGLEQLDNSDSEANENLEKPYFPLLYYLKNKYRYQNQN